MAPTYCKQLEDGRWWVCINLIGAKFNRIFEDEQDAKTYADFLVQLREVAHAEKLTQFEVRERVNQRFGHMKKVKPRRPARKKVEHVSDTVQKLLEQVKVNGELLEPALKEEFARIYSGLVDTPILRIEPAQVRAMELNAALDHNARFRPVWTELSKKLREIICE